MWGVLARQIELQTEHFEGLLNLLNAIQDAYDPNYQERK